MRRTLVALVAAAMLAALIPGSTLAAPPAPPTANAFVYVGTFGDLVGYSDTDGIWNTRDGNKDVVFQLDLAPNSTQDLASVKITVSGGTWDTVAGNGTWAIGVTTKAHGKRINNADSSINSMDLANGLRIYLHVAGGGYVHAGSGNVTVHACSDAGCTTDIYSATITI